MVTHSSTSRPVQCLCMAERTGCPVFTDLWSYVLETSAIQFMILKTKCGICEHVKPTLLSDVLQAHACSRVKVSQLRVYTVDLRLLTGSGLEGSMGYVSDDSAFLDPNGCR